TGSASAGSSTTIALWPKRSKKISPGCIVATPIRGAAWATDASSTSMATSTRPATRVAGLPLRTGEGALRRIVVVGMHAHVQRVQAACVGAGHAEAEAAQGELLARLGQVADRGGHQAADRVVLVVVEIGAEALVEIVDRGQRVDHVLAVGLGGDQRVGVLGVVVLVVDLADDLLQHVL